MKGRIQASFSEPKLLKDLQLYGRANYDKADIKLNDSISKVPGANEVKDILIREITGGEGLKKFLPSEFAYPLFPAKMLSHDPNLQRLVNPRLQLKENEGTVTLTVSASIE